MNYSKIIEKLYQKVKESKPEGKVADYIPELARVNPDKFGVSLIDVTGEEYSKGDCSEKFSIQSISKIFTLSVAFSILGEKIWNRIGVEPSGSPFNSIVQLEYEKGKPRNPFINAGALVISDILLSELKEPKKDIIKFISELCGCSDLNINEKVSASEKDSGFRNAALINMMKSYGNIHNSIENVLDLYYTNCSIEMSCSQLAKAFLPYADLHRRFNYNGFLLTKSQIKRINALMLSCGFYDESGEFAFKVGLPGKSGVGGGIVAIHPNQFSIATWSPRINQKGNSVFGMKFLEKLTTITENSIF